jgi:hypothetical protein
LKITGPPLGRKVFSLRRIRKDCGEYCEAAGAIAAAQRPNAPLQCKEGTWLFVSRFTEIERHRAARFVAINLSKIKLSDVSICLPNIRYGRETVMFPSQTLGRPFGGLSAFR